MRLKNEFVIQASAERLWEVLNDIERIAPFIPGFQLQDAEGDRYTGTVKMKVGAITVSYNAEIEVLERRAEDRRVVMEISGRERRGPGTMSATVTSILSPNGSSTRVSLTTDVSVTGRVAQFGGGVLSDVSSSLVDQFARALENGLQGPEAIEPAEARTESQALPPRPTPSPQPDALDVTDAVRSSLAHRVLPQLAGAALIALVAYIAGRRRGR